MKLKPVFKNGKKTDTSNYRAISLFPAISKTIERVTHGQANIFLSDEDILCNYQSGFGGNRSTNLYLSFSTNTVLKEFDEGLLTGLIIVDLQKEFDTMDPEILLQNLKAIRFSERKHYNMA